MTAITLGITNDFPNFFMPTMKRGKLRKTMNRPIGREVACEIRNEIPDIPPSINSYGTRKRPTPIALIKPARTHIKHFSATAPTFFLFIALPLNKPEKSTNINILFLHTDRYGQ